MCVALFALAIVGARAQNAGHDVNTDCTCACAASASLEATKYDIAVGSEAACTSAKCITERPECTAGGSVTASYHDCTCHCCNVGQCQNDLQAYTFMANSPERCTASACASQFFQCPNDPNSDVANPATASFTYATYQDCTCGCKRTSGDAFVYKMFYAGSPRSAPRTSARRTTTPAPTRARTPVAAGGTVEATYSGVVPEAPAAPAPAQTSSRVTVTSKSTEMPTWAAALLSIFIIGLVGTVVGIFVHRKVQAERGFRWVKFDEQDEKRADADRV
jgi:hypothetical protein